MKRRRVSIGGQLGTIYLLVVALLATVCIVVITALSEMREDAKRLLEETEEHAVTGTLVIQLDTLRGLVETWSEDDPARQLQRARDLAALIQDAAERLHGLEPDDPSRIEHQAAEDVKSSVIARDLDVVMDVLTSDPTQGDLVRAERVLQQAIAQAGRLHEETYAESRAANRDLVRRGRQARRIMIATVACAALALAAALAYVLRSIVRPIRELQGGAERFGAGDLAHRIPARTRDEVGDLARAFNGMADRIAEARGDLEARVATRTRELLRAARLADLGVLAAGVAHEVNNPLASIASCAEGLERRLRAGSVDAREAREYLDTIASEAYRAREITAQLLSLASQDRDDAAPVDVRLVLRQVRIAARHLLEHRGQHLAVDAQGDLGYLGSNPELMQILTNLLLNARDASPDGARIALRARREEDEVVIEIEDRGTGIDPEHIESIFDPFYTTKRPGKGTGLGLSVVAALVEARGGRIRVESRPGAGTTFQVRFPSPVGAAT